MPICALARAWFKDINGLISLVLLLKSKLLLIKTLVSSSCLMSTFEIIPLIKIILLCSNLLIKDIWSLGSYVLSLKKLKLSILDDIIWFKSENFQSSILYLESLYQ